MCCAAFCSFGSTHKAVPTVLYRWTLAGYFAKEVAKKHVDWLKWLVLHHVYWRHKPSESSWQFFFHLFFFFFNIFLFSIFFATFVWFLPFFFIYIYIFFSMLFYHGCLSTVLSVIFVCPGVFRQFSDWSTPEWQRVCTTLLRYCRPKGSTRKRTGCRREFTSLSFIACAQLTEQDLACRENRLWQAYITSDIQHRKVRHCR